MLPDILTVVFCFLKTDLIRACYAGALPSFATCIALEDFQCWNNQFTGAYSRVSTDRSVATCIVLTDFVCNENQFSGA